jgi:hypothetical protein
MELDELLLKISKHLRANGIISWSDSFERLYEEAKQYKGDYDIDFLMKIKSLFGGMGSFNDIVLSKDHKPLIAENIELDGLSDQLYEKFKELRLAKYKGKIEDF